MLTSSIPRMGRRMAVLLALTGAFFYDPSPALAHNDGAYWHDSAAAAHNPQWMLTIAATKKLTELSLPGTHDSGTYPGIGGDIAQTQTMPIRAQLDSGIRYLDIRLKYYDRFALRNCNDSYMSANCQMLVFHGGIDMFLPFESGILRPALAFLKANPSEMVIMRIARETADCDCSPGPALNALLEQQAVFDGVATGQKYSDYLLPSGCPAPDKLTLGPVRPVNAGPDPSSCDARGKLLVFDQYLGSALASNHYYRHNGLTSYTSPTFQTLRTNWDLYDRLWLPVKGHLANAAKSTVMTDFYLAGIGGADGGFPYFFASGHASPATGAARLSTGLVDGISADASTYPDFPRTSCAFGLCTISFEGMNTLVADYLLRPEFHFAGSRVGLVTADFPGSRFITAVASVNRGVSFERPTFAYTLVTSDGARYQPGTWTNRQVVVTPQCDVVCIGNRAVVSEDAPNGFVYTMSGGGYGVSFTTSPVRIDKTPPAVVYSGNLGSYAPGQSVDIRCEATDKESGVASTTCADIRGLASSFGPGSHRYSATAKDVAGNTGTGAATFTVVALPGDSNFDGAIDCRDLAVVKASFGKRAGMAGFDARADTNGDGVVDIRDLAIIAQKLPAGTTCP